MGVPETDGRLKFIVCGWVHAHDSEAVAGVVRVQKMDLVVGKIAGNDWFHGQLLSLSGYDESVKLEGGG
jgi:hypothetical protein